MNTKYMFIVATMTIMLIGATALANEDAFAKKKGYEKSQAVTQLNNCGNGDTPFNVGCQNTATQIQGEDNSASSASAQEFSTEIP